MRSLIATLICTSWLAGCAHPVPPELVAARQAYQHAAASPASELSPAELHKAAEALRAAEAAFADDPTGYEVRDLAYVASRKSQIAEAVASIELERRTQARADAAYRATQEEVVKDTKEQLATAQDAATEAARQLAETERARREADQRAAEALAALQQLAAVTDEARGKVITLSGSVIFRSGEATIIPDAQARLDQVAQALLTEPDRSLLVEGHTDSQGSDSYNLGLSQRRADAVREYLISRGYDGARIQARGIGEARPVADNASPEGRANNRRVEIIIQPRLAAIN